MKKLLALIAGVMLVFATPTTAQAADIDFPVTSVTVSADPVNSGDNVSFTVTGQNNTGSYQSSVSFEGKILGAAGDLTYVSCSFSPPPSGTYACGYSNSGSDYTVGGGGTATPVANGNTLTWTITLDTLSTGTYSTEWNMRTRQCNPPACDSYTFLYGEVYDGPDLNVI